MKKTLYFFSALLVIGGLIFYYFSRQPVGYDVRLPVDFVPYTDQPRTVVEIEGNIYRLLIDSGSASCLTLEKELLDKLQDKEFLQEAIIINAVGEKHLIQTYRIPQVKVWYLKITDVEIENATRGVTVDGPSNLTYEQVLEHRPGLIGRELLKMTNWFMDFHNYAMFACKQITSRKKNGYHLDKLVQIPFLIDSKQGIILEIGTDLGVKRFMLDTGASCNFIKPSVIGDQICEDQVRGMQAYTSSKFVLGNKDFGIVKFGLFEIPAFFGNLDGILGMDFFNEHVVYLDFEKKIAHIGRSDECISGEARDKLRAFQFPLPEGITLNTHP